MHKYFSTRQYKDIIRKVYERCQFHSIAVPQLEFKGTVKLHGTNSSFYNVLSNDEIVVQSRNNVITVEKDNAGFAAYVNSQREIVSKIFTEIKKQFPDAVKDKTAVVYGEWAGGSIQKKVALSNVEKFYAVFAIKLTDNKEHIEVDVNESDEEQDVNNNFDDGKWLTEEQIESVLTSVGKEIMHKVRMFSIYDFPTFTVKIDMANPKLTQNKLIEITNSVEEECPVGKQLGSIGVGEGVVWKCISPVEVLQTDDLIFKVKGEKHSVSKVKTIAEVDEVKLNSIKEFVDAVVTENRLNQGIEYLKEQSLGIVMQNMGVFLKWLANDCIKEEGGMMEASGLEKKDVMSSISNKAKQWYLVLANNLDK